jgi:polyisoprenoid-binding protein YceI
MVVRTGSVGFTLVPVLALGALAFKGSPEPAVILPASPVNYTIDGSHSSVIFRIKHNNAAYFYGRFGQISGAFTLDDADPAATPWRSRSGRRASRRTTRGATAT